MSLSNRSLSFLNANLTGFFARPFSRLLVYSDFAKWALDEDAKAMVEIARDLGFGATLAYRPGPFLRQCVHYTSSFSLLDDSVFSSRHRVSVDYYHGKPGQGEVFRRVFDQIKKNASRIARMRISYSEMLEVALEAGIAREKIFQIPIGIDPRLFQVQSEESRRRAREKFGLPASAIVIGSFQKDGEGWGEGNEPKWVKGPDVFVDTVEALYRKFPETVVLLTGPSRGYVKKRLAAAGIPFRHVFFDSYPQINECYQALDLYVVSSREEGGPKAILESMITGVPIVSTRVGQAIDLVKDGENGLIVAVDDVEALVHSASRAIQDLGLRERMKRGGLATAMTESYGNQKGRWRDYFDGYLVS